MAKDYKKIAEQQYSPQYNEKVNAVNNNLNSTITGLEGNKSGVNQNYDVQIQKQNLMNTLAKNNYNNQMTGRGIGKSSIATSGMAGMDNSNAKQVGYINMDRTNSLNGIDANIATARQNASNSLSQLTADKLDYITKLAYELEDRDWDKDYKNQQFAWDKDSFAQTMAFNRANAQAEQSYRNQQLAMQQAEMNRGEDNSASQDDYLSVQSILQDKEMSLQQKRDYIGAMTRGSKDSNFNSYAKEATDSIGRQSMINSHIPTYGSDSVKSSGSKSITNPFKWWGKNLWEGNAFNIRSVFGK